MEGRVIRYGYYVSGVKWDGCLEAALPACGRQAHRRLILWTCLPTGREVFSGYLCHLPEENNVVPLRPFLLLTVFCVGFGSSKAKRTIGASIRQELLFWISANELGRWLRRLRFLL